MKQHKYNMGLVGNCSFSALVDDRASIRWMCWPRFDSSFVFGGLLDDGKGGDFYIKPALHQGQSSQSYIKNTNVLCTSFVSADGAFDVYDFAPRYEKKNEVYRPLTLVRKIMPTDGAPTIQIGCNPKGNYGATNPSVTVGAEMISYQGLESKVVLTSNASLTKIAKEEPFVLSEPIYLMLSYGEDHVGHSMEIVDRSLAQTVAYWQEWTMRIPYASFGQEAIIRSALTLQMHQFEDTGAIIAATTTSLPEFPGSTRNWDYRFCWIRDAHYSIKALCDLNHKDVLSDYFRYVNNIQIGNSGRFSPLYPITLNGIPEETILDLEGYLGEKPVRVGNQANEHVQNDAYGQVLVTLLPFFGDDYENLDNLDAIMNQVKYCLDMIDQTMDEPDQGLWEFRGLSQCHSYTFLFHWAGADAGVQIAERVGDTVLKAYALNLQKRAAANVEACFDKGRGVYTQAIGSPNLDASLLQLINMGYLDPHSDRAKQHVQVLEEELKTDTGLFYRYIHADDFGAPESTFLICAFWYVETLARMGRNKEAMEIFDKLLSHGNHLSLFAEDVHEKSGSQWGNFPQTYSHVGLINAAIAISANLDKTN